MLKNKITKHNFDDLECGQGVIINDNGIIFLGMKVMDIDGETIGILDLDENGRFYTDVDKYDIVELIDLKVVRDEGDE